MHRIDNTTASTTLPTAKAPGQPGFFTTGTIGGQSATIVEADWLNTVQEELLAILSADAMTPSKTTNNQVITAILDLMRKNTRQRLTGAFDLYVATTGSDTNDGLTPSTPLATLQAAWNYIMARLDCGNNTITVHIADGTYSPVVCQGIPMGGGQVVFQGNIAAPANVTVHSSAAWVSSIYAVASSITVRGLTLSSTGNASSHGLACNNSDVTIDQPVIFASCTGAQIFSVGGGMVYIDSNYSISAGATVHLYAQSNGTIGQFPNITVTITLAGSPNFSSAFAASEANGVIFLLPANFHFTGTAVGTRYTAVSGGQISVIGGGANFFPGSIAGTADATTYGSYRG